jgi:branched-chain amino acid transport system ATP-binding protein
VLRLENLNTGYDKKQVLFDLSLHVNTNEIVSIIGPNGAGKSTILKAVSGLLPIWKGDIHFNGISINGNSSSQNIALGLTFCPQGNRVFDELSVYENLEIGGYHVPNQQLHERIDNALKLFPVLQKRIKQHAGTLSGGEQQMLALARALVPQPKLLLLDEPSLGLAPNLLDDVFERLVEINQDLKISILLVEQKVRNALSISHRVYSIKFGSVAFEGSPEQLKQDKEKLKELFL